MSKTEKSPPLADRLVMLFSALADPTRLRLLNLMSSGEVCVCFLVETLEEGQPKISRHLAYLRRAGVVEGRREGKWIHYRIKHPAELPLRRVLENLLAWMENDPEMQQHRSRLSSLCCAPAPPVQLKATPVSRRASRGVGVSR